MKKVFTKEEINGLCKTPEEVNAYDSFKDGTREDLQLVELLRDQSVEPKDKFFCLMLAATVDEQYAILEFISDKGGKEGYKAPDGPMSNPQGLEDIISFIESLDE